MTKVCFLGTPDFAAKHLDYLLKNSAFKVVGVVTQPDRPAGRKMQLTPSAVKSLAILHNLPVVTPENLRKEPEIFEQIKSWGADVAVVVAFGQIVSQDFLDYFKHGAVNIHGSLLPRWRGAAPIQRAIQAGDKESGVALQKMVKKLDAGPMIGVRKLAIDEVMTATDLYNQLAELGCSLLGSEFLDYVQGKITLILQNESLVTLAPKIEKEESLILWGQSAQIIHNKVRAFSMGPGTHCMLQGKRLKIHRTEIIAEESKVTAGYVSECAADKLFIQTAQGLISLLEVQPESKAKVSIAEFLKGHNFRNGDLFE